VPSAFAGVLGQESAVSAEMVVLAGEAFPAGLLEQTRRAMPGAVVANIYGPTEATVYATGWFSDTDADSEGPMVPIGRPVAGKATYVLDAGLSPAPVGVWGELYLGGGLARGYHGRSGLTSERFVADPFRSGGRLYRTGDVVRWRADGSLEYAGRGDDQVKIRGFRIELGEIESVLSSHPSVAQSVVVAREDRPGVKRLAAYLVTDGDEAPDVDALREHVASALPEYMVPAAFVVLDALPLNANGKLDRRALPAPEFASADGAYVAPRTESERILCGVWAEVLGLERVGIEDNFFDLGGDSIISLQVVSRARRAGLALSSRDVFLHPTLSTLAAGLTEADQGSDDAGPAQQGIVSGPVAPTPVREWYFDTHPVAPEHFNMSTAFQLPEDVDLDALRIAVGALLSQHDALRSTFTRTDEGTWTGYITSALDVDSVFTVHELAGDLGGAANGDADADADADADGDADADVDAQWRALVVRTQSGLDLEHGPLFRVVVGVPCGDGGPARLLITAHHLVIDGVSWRILLSDLATAYDQAVSVAATDLGPKSTSVRAWADRFNTHVRDGGFGGQLEYWRSVTSAADTRLPLDTPDGGNRVADQAAVMAYLDVDDTHALLHQVPGRFRTQINDVLLAALARTLRTWTGHDRVAVNLEGHGREELFDDIDLTRTVGWFTSIYPVALELPETDDWPATMRSVKRQLRAVPDRGVGYGALRYLSGELAGDPDPRISFNYLGQFGIGSAGSSAGTGSAGGGTEAATADRGLLGTSLATDGQEHGPQQERNHLIDVVAVVDEGRFVVTWFYSTAVHRESTVTALAEDFIAGLRSVSRG
ncbi:condensation domain-containing protein, partial [Streptomyces sp. NPDC055037]